MKCISVMKFDEMIRYKGNSIEFLGFSQRKSGKVFKYF